jgi:hypothetical protein
MSGGMAGWERVGHVQFIFKELKGEWVMMMRHGQSLTFIITAVAI